MENSNSMGRLTRVQQINKRRAQVRDILYIGFSTLILIGLCKTVLTPFISDTHHTVDAQTLPEVPTVTFPTETISTPTPTAIPFHIQDKRVAALVRYLRYKGSPLADYAGFIVQESDNYGLDWTLIVAIAGKESGFGIYIPSGSYNAWGLGGANNMMYFSSWEDAIAYEAQLLSNNYRAAEYAGIQYNYCPSSECDPNWTNDVTHFSEEMVASK